MSEARNILEASKSNPAADKIVKKYEAEHKTLSDLISRLPPTVTDENIDAVRKKMKLITKYASSIDNYVEDLIFLNKKK